MTELHWNIILGTLFPGSETRIDACNKEFRVRSSTWTPVPKYFIEIICYWFFRVGQVPREGAQGPTPARGPGSVSISCVISADDVNSSS